MDLFVGLQLYLAFEQIKGKIVTVTLFKDKTVFLDFDQSCIVDDLILYILRQFVDGDSLPDPIGIFGFINGHEY